MAKIPKQRGGGQTGNTGWGHRSNRVTSSRRGGNSHAGGAGFGKKAGGAICGLIVFGCAALILTSVAYGATQYL